MDSVEINKFLKFFALKCTQVIVQSRLGNTINTKCAKEGQDWVSDKRFYEFSLVNRRSTNHNNSS